ncbi:RICIN domain-containing protein [Streptomyces sp. NPDC004549]|uniref:RICIN domain-containing protein n=1 Tax=Streptomyces sp. NPDC004549 TaxID=3154283 RepID=UPI0033AB44CB
MAGTTAAHAQSAPSGKPGSKLILSGSRLVNLKSGKYLAAVGTSVGSKVVQKSLDTSNGLQTWETVLDGNYYSFENIESGLNLGIDGASSASGAAAIVAKGSSNLNQDWARQYYDGGEYYALKNRQSGLCLGISGASTANGAQAAQFPCDGSANQGWTDRG